MCRLALAVARWKVGISMDKCTCTGDQATTNEADCKFHTDLDVEVELDEWGAQR